MTQKGYAEMRDFFYLETVPGRCIIYYFIATLHFGNKLSFFSTSVFLLGSDVPLVSIFF